MMAKSSAPTSNRLPLCAADSVSIESAVLFHSHFISRDEINMRIAIALLLLFVSMSVGCGPQQTILPTTELTEEQKKAIQAEDARIADEESQGSVNKKKPGAKR